MHSRTLHLLVLVAFIGSSSVADDKETVDDTPNLPVSILEPATATHVEQESYTQDDDKKYGHKHLERDEPGIFMPNTFLSGVASKSKYRPKCTFIDLDCSTKKIDCFVLLCYGKKKRVIEHEEKRRKRSLTMPFGKR